MIKNPELYRPREAVRRWRTLRRMSAEESIAIGEALLTSEIMKLAWRGKRRRPKCLAVALGIRRRFWTLPGKAAAKPHRALRVPGRQGRKRGQKVKTD